MLKNISKIVSVIFFAGILVLFTGCANSDDPIATEAITAIDLEKITPQDIVDGKIDVADLSKDQRIQFLKNHDSFEAEKTSEQEAKNIMLAENFLIFDFEAKDFAEVISFRNSDLSEIEIWENAYAQKGLYDAGWFDLLSKEINGEVLDDSEAIVFSEKFEQVMQDADNKAAKKFNIESSSFNQKSGGCNSYDFPLRGAKTTNGNIRCIYVGKASTPNDPNDCDHFLVFQSMGLRIAANWRLNLYINTAFGGYHKIILRNKSGRTHMLIGDGINTLFNASDSYVQNYLKTNLKLKV